jgi:hypothetical protein
LSKKNSKLKSLSSSVNGQDHTIAARRGVAGEDGIGDLTNGSGGSERERGKEEGFGMFSPPTAEWGI